jgi:endo-1,4-beta-xylanase
MLGKAFAYACLGVCALASAGPVGHDTLKDAYAHSFPVGTAVNVSEISGQDKADEGLIVGQFNSISPENVLKWDSVHPTEAGYDFTLADRYVAFGIEHRMLIVGHTLVWHSQTPDWVFHDASGKLVDRETLLTRMHNHIATVVGRYRGRIRQWDVVNEALEGNGQLRESLWLKIIGPDYIEKAFQYAHEADPSAQLAYNDYSLEDNGKCKGALELVKRLKKEGVPIDAVGLQSHESLDWPTAKQVDTTISAFERLGVKVNISELDVDVLPHPGGHTADVGFKIKPDAALNPYVDGLPESIAQRQAARYGDLFKIFQKHKDSIARVTLWGASDQSSWLNNWPIAGRKNYALLFDRAGQPKAAFDEVIQAAQIK